MWAIVYGSLSGFVFKFLACWEECFILIRKDIQLWKKGSKINYQNYIDYKLKKENYNQKNNPSYSTKSESQLKELYPRSPFPIDSIVVYIGWAITLSIFRPFVGILEGPGVVFKDWSDYWDVHVLKQSDTACYERLLDLEKKRVEKSY